ncbi:hypothetical protein C8J57DRAFT_1738742 [Mycena rebaudengoi]|nr:hypothetical protein C8J57DRAFT_1738742 [Mycena rebaudengoi]
MAPRAHLCPGISQYRPPFARNRATTLLASSRLLAPPRPAGTYSHFYKLSLSLPSAPRHGIRIADLCIAQIWDPVLLCPPFCFAAQRCGAVKGRFALGVPLAGAGIVATASPPRGRRPPHSCYVCAYASYLCNSARDRIAQRYARARVRFWRAFLPCLRFAIRVLPAVPAMRERWRDTLPQLAMIHTARLCAGTLPALHSCAIAIRLRYAPARASRVAGNRPAACDSSHAQLGSRARLTPPVAPFTQRSFVNRGDALFPRPKSAPAKPWICAVALRATSTLPFPLRFRCSSCRHSSRHHTLAPSFVVRVLSNTHRPMHIIAVPPRPRE